MKNTPSHSPSALWDYLIVTASNEMQAAAYRTQLALRGRLGLLAGVREVLVVPDPGGKRVGSGGSTLYCLLEVLNRSIPGPASGPGTSLCGAGTEDPCRVFERLRVLIVHAGGDSRRLPAYGVCGKLFIPVPAGSDSCLPATLFDRQLSTYLALPTAVDEAGQIVITSGDVLLRFDPSEVTLAASGMTGLGCFTTPEQATGHGVFCRDEGNGVRRFLQKPSLAEQQAEGAIDTYGQTVLDIGVTHLDARTAVRLLSVFGLAVAGGRAHLAADLTEIIENHGLDFYREICCALGQATRCEQYLDSVRRAGSTWDIESLKRIFEGLHEVPFRVNVLPRCGFLHFGTSRQIIYSGQALLQHDQGTPVPHTILDVTTETVADGQMIGGNAWVEGCRIRAPLTLGGDNLVTGVDVDTPLSLPAGACLDVLSGRNAEGRVGWFVRCYGIADTFKESMAAGATFCGRPASEWLAAVGTGADEVWEPGLPDSQRTLWNARVFPAETDPQGWQNWLWMFEPTRASAEQKARWRTADRYSLTQMANLADPEAFLQRRLDIRAARIRGSLRRTFRLDSGFSASDLAAILRKSRDPAAWVAAVLAEAQWHHDGASRGSGGLESLVFPRVVHTLGSALEQATADPGIPLATALPSLEQQLTPYQQAWLQSVGMEPGPQQPVRAWSERLQAAAFRGLGRTILASGGELPPPPRQALRSDEIVWGRVPARLDVAGGWSDTPPYSLEHGGCVVNTAVNLNGQPPIQAYARVIPRPMIRISSIDLGVTLEVSDLATLLDYRQPGSEFALAKAALALSGFSPDAAAWPPGITLPEMLRQFGGGIELTTLAAIPKGSGLGTSSIMGAVTLAVIQRVLGKTPTERNLFHDVLRLEQALTTGGGWQDQIGGSVGGAKIIRSRAGLIPDAAIHFLPPDVLDPHLNGRTTLLYYTGITRLAKNILEQVVGRYLDRNRHAMATLHRIHALAPSMADAVSRKDRAAFGRLVTTAWELNKELDPNSTNAEVESLMARVRNHVHGAKLIGAGGGGFMLLVCRSAGDAVHLRRDLEDAPPNPRARFFDFAVNPEGLVVTVC
ncbi:MAG: hypothetical protein KA354_00240 [Phycisphaerae bacterium]|nr:hypothetical protein [Phycisphaerae bacterium]